MTKILLIGLGRWGNNHLRVLNSLPVELHVADVQSQQLDSARRMGVPKNRLTVNYLDFVDRVDAAVVVTPAPTHFEICADLLNRGRDVFVEKPITLKSAEAKQLTELAEQGGCILQVGHIFRFDPASRWLREAIQAGHFGRVRMLRGTFSGFKRPRSDCGVTFSDAIHFVDLFNYFLDQTPQRVAAVIYDFLGRGLDDASHLSLEYDTQFGPTWGMVKTDCLTPGKVREVTVIGSELSAVCDFNASQYKIKTFANRHLKVSEGFKAEEGALRQIECAPEEPLLAELRAFVNAIQTRQTPRVDGWAGYDSIRVLEAAMRAAETGATVGIA